MNYNGLDSLPDNELANISDYSNVEMSAIAFDIRTALIKYITQSGGHLGPNLGVVELTLVIHKLFNLNKDILLWDTGHQTYVHKILTGRFSQFKTIRQYNGLSGYSNRRESKYDIIENSHASTALSYADGITKGLLLQNKSPYVIVVIGDGAMTGGLVWEAINNISCYPYKKLIIIINDNGRSYRPTIGGIANYLLSLRTSKVYQLLNAQFYKLRKGSLLSQLLHNISYGLKIGLGHMFIRRTIFHDMGIKYFGPLDGHNIVSLQNAFEKIKKLNSPVVLHCITKKGHGYRFAESNIKDKHHAIGNINSYTGKNNKQNKQTTWTEVFGKEIVKIASENNKIICITAAMLDSVGLSEFAISYPDRIFDIGIAEQHAVVSASGLSYVGYHPVIVIYSTFLNRAFDQIIMDCALHNINATFIVDRAGITGEDGASHNGIWDLGYFQMARNISIFLPRDELQLKHQLRTAINSEGITVCRFPKGAIPHNIKSIENVDNKIDYLYNTNNSIHSKKVLIIAFGDMCSLGIKIADTIYSDNKNINIAVIDLIPVIPIDVNLLQIIEQYDIIATIEDHNLIGGIGQSIALTVNNSYLSGKKIIKHFGIQSPFLPHGSRHQILEYSGLSVNKIVKELLSLI